MSTHHTFGEALEAVKQGKSISRQGWNGKNMCVFLNRGAIGSNNAPAHPEVNIEGIPASMFDVWTEGVVTRLPNLNMCSASGATVTGWLASQSDMLAEDWRIHE